MTKITGNGGIYFIIFIDINLLTRLYIATYSIVPPGVSKIVSTFKI